MPEFDLQHGLAVASWIPGDDLEGKLVALLHDAVEDGACTGLELVAAGLSFDAIVAIRALTRDPLQEPYDDYIERIKASGSELALRVKRADLQANLARMDDEHEGLRARYEAALEALS